MNVKKSSTQKNHIFIELGAFTVVPNSVIKIWPEIGNNAMLLYLYLCFRQDEKHESWPSYNTISNDTGMRRQVIADAATILESHNLLTRQRRFSNTTIYRVCFPAAPISTTGGRMDEETLPISPTGGLMESPPLVHPPDSISPTGGLPLVRQEDTNKTQLTRLIKQEEKEAPPPLPISVVKILSDASGLVSFPPDQKEFMEVVYSLAETYGVEATTAAMKKSYAAWINTNRRDNRGKYRRTNLAWINWAMEELTPKPERPIEQPKVKKLCPVALQLYQAIDPQQPGYLSAVAAYDAHLKTCTACNNGNHNQAEIAIGNLAEKMSVK